ncbi:thiopeptide-type bacteriocin biosynthesis domain protein [Nocardiopsis alba ATCC BAA-2165]|uniref:Thiopeptide-type bacteriocin biosynthesis domain protein n=1 Tax=Nocardiopsis alba (strain ATCC BAA-2165 / BE74) TaxID=1205910 RepID=J7L1J2_NOCAA|nr:lantibiotic dehydratase [Nocardiopsis alba]AFR07513.1 thiopeptide-type bacteriocin biosynthesis domain protein [Nocardiopsis alba ATCC BAA-2165]
MLGAAIRDAGPTLVQRIGRVCQGNASGRDLTRVARSTARYVLRAQSRAAPFGLFAGVAPTRFTSAVSGTIGVDHRPMARVSAAWTTAAVDRLESCEPEFTAHLPVVVNTLAVVRDDRILVEHQPEPGADQGTRSSLRLTAPARMVLETARTPTSWAQVEAALNTAFPDRGDAVRALVGTLVRHRVLLTCLHPPMDTPDPLRHLITAARGAGADRYPRAAAVLAHLEAAQRSLEDHDHAPEPAVRAAAMSRSRTALAAVAPVDAPTSVDLRLESDLDLPRTVSWQIQDAAGVLARLSPVRQCTPAWADYHRRFCERYGIGAVVPVTEVIDPDRGLGLPAGFHGSRLPTPPAQALSERDAVLLDLAQQAAVDGTGEIVVDDALLDRLGAAPLDAVWPHTELRVRVHATSREALDAGDFRVVVAGASRGAGTTVGRFLDLLPPSGRDPLLDLYRRLPTLRQDAILAQLTCPASSARGDQVSRTPVVLPTRLALGQHHPADPNALGLDDLAVTADPHRLHLVTRYGLRPVEPVVFHALEFTRAAHPQMRFLTELPWAFTAVLVPFSWGAATHLPYLPRVRWRQCVLAPARWRLDAHTLPGPHAPWQEWVDHLDQWRATRRVPAQVELGENDQRLRLNLDLSAHQDLVRSELVTAGRVFLREASTDRELGWIGGRAHELVATVTATQTPIRVRTLPGSAHPRSPEHLPGTMAGWCSLKLYGHPDRTTELITEEFPRLSASERALSWWFLRYRDPEPHLRVRIRVEGPEQLGAVHTWTRDLRERGLVATIVHDTYTPESGRFGPGAAMKAAETLFVADSRAVTSQLTTESTDHGTRVWAAVSMTDLVHHLLGDEPTARRWLIDHAPPGVTDRGEAQRTITLTHPDHDDRPALLRDAWQNRAEAASAYTKALADFGFTASHILPDLLHLHSTRLFGPDPDAERACLSLARAAALSWNARAKEGQ